MKKPPKSISEKRLNILKDKFVKSKNLSNKEQLLLYFFLSYISAHKNDEL